VSQNQLPNEVSSQSLSNEGEAQSVNRQAIVAQIERVQLNEGDLKAIREALTSRNDFKIMCGCLSLKRFLT